MSVSANNETQFDTFLSEIVVKRPVTAFDQVNCTYLPQTHLEQEKTKKLINISAFVWHFLQTEVIRFWAENVHFAIPNRYCF